MKALISPIEVHTVVRVVSWKYENNEWVPEEFDNIENCFRIAEVKEKEFEVAQPLFWVDCSENCLAGQWYYKDGVCSPTPVNIPPSNEQVEI